MFASPVKPDLDRELLFDLMAASKMEVHRETHAASDSRALSVVIIGLILVQTGAAGQSATGLAIQILETNEGENLIDKELPPLKVRVMDRTGRVIPEASVLFQAPEDGPTGHFLPNSSQITVYTDTQGMATAPRFRTNSKVGEYQIQVVASYRDSVSRAVIPQTNIFKLKSSNRKFIILSAVIGGAAAATLATRRGNSGPASSALEALAVAPTITLGGPSVGVSSPILASVPTMPSADTLSPPSASSGSTGTSPSGGSVQPAVTTQPSVPTPCAAMPPNSKKQSCR